MNFYERGLRKISRRKRHRLAREIVVSIFLLISVSLLSYTCTHILFLLQHLLGWLQWVTFCRFSREFEPFFLTCGGINILKWKTWNTCICRDLAVREGNRSFVFLHFGSNVLRIMRVHVLAKIYYSIFYSKSSWW